MARIQLARDSHTIYLFGELDPNDHIILDLPLPLSWTLVVAKGELDIRNRLTNATFTRKAFGVYRVDPKETVELTSNVPTVFCCPFLLSNETNINTLLTPEQQRIIEGKSGHIISTKEDEYCTYGTVFTSNVSSKFLNYGIKHFQLDALGAPHAAK